MIFRYIPFKHLFHFWQIEKCTTCMFNPSKTAELHVSQNVVFRWKAYLNVGPADGTGRLWRVSDEEMDGVIDELTSAASVLEVMATIRKLRSYKESEKGVVETYSERD